MKPRSALLCFHVTLLACFACIVDASANLGQTMKEVEARYGAGKVVEAQKPAEQAELCAFTDLRVLVEFWRGRSCGEQYRKANGSSLSDAEIAALLQSNADQSSWHAAGETVWVRVDKNAVAYTGDKQRALVVQTYAFHVEEKKNTSQAAAPEKPKAPSDGTTHPAVTKIVSRYLAPNVPPESFGARPKTIYRAGDTFLRVEEEDDPGQHLHELLICGEPDIWMINLETNTGQHVVDPGPTFVTHDTIMELGAPGELTSLELGREQEFFEHHQAAKIDPAMIDGQRCEALEYKRDPYRLVLNVRSDTHKPFQLDVFKNGQTDFSVRYLSYETGLPFDPALFTPPSDVTLTEAKSNAK